MHKRAPLEKFQAVKEKLAKVGISIKRNLDTEEYQVYPKGDEPGGRSTYFTGSLDVHKYNTRYLPSTRFSLQKLWEASKNKEKEKLAGTVKKTVRRKKSKNDK